MGVPGVAAVVVATVVAEAEEEALLF